MKQHILRSFLALVLVIIGCIKMDNVSILEVMLYRLGPNLSFDTYSLFARLVVSLYWISALLLLPISTAKKGKVFSLIILTTAIVLAIVSLLYPALDLYFGASRTFKLPAIINISIHLMLILLVFFVRTAYERSNSKLIIRIIPITVVILLLLPNILSIPSVYAKSLDKEIEFSDSALQAEIASGNIPATFVKGKKVLPFYSVNCRFCRYSAERLSAFFKKEGLPLTDMNIVFWATKVDPTLFYEITNSKTLDFTPVSTQPFMKIVDGRMPLILLIEDGEVKGKMRYGNLDETEILAFLKS